MVRDMSKSKYSCKHCDTPIPTELVKQWEFNVCPVCGHLYPKCIEYLEQFFRIIQLSKKLEAAGSLALKSEPEAAVRDAVVTIETTVKEISDLDALTGADLMAKAFSFKFDSQTNAVTVEPKIKLNDLSTISKRNEQDGVRFVAMGLMQGVRNIFMHSKGTKKLYYCIQTITTVDWILKQIEGWGVATD